jgi:hypothetical protein
MAAKISFPLSEGKTLRYTLAIDKSEVTATFETDITKLEIPFFRISPCRISTKSFCNTLPIFFCLFVSMLQKYNFYFSNPQDTFSNNHILLIIRKESTFFQKESQTISQT